MALERMEGNIAAVLRQDMECIAAVHCLKVGLLSSLAYTALQLPLDAMWRRNCYVLYYC